VIAGATATGKTRLSLDLAAHLGEAEIVGADSRQVYRGMDIGTAKPTPDERAVVPHHGLDLADPDEDFTAADYRRHALDALAGIAQRRRVALLVGGTGLYLRTIARGLPLEQAGHDPEVRARLEGRLAAEGREVLADELRRRAPDVAAVTDLANPRRVVRALERLETRGNAAPPVAEGYPAPVLWLGLRLAPAEHAAAIEARARHQFGSGMLDEAGTLRARYPEDLRAFDAIGYREAFDVLAGRASLEEAIARDVARTRAYAKRQRTWFRSERDIEWLDGDGARAQEQARAAVDRFGYAQA
jgi:tRNA dimethylallyltransferase